MSTLITLNDALKSLASYEEFEGVLNLDTLHLGPDTYTLVAPAQWHITLTNTGSAYLAQGRISADLSVDCARCTEAFTLSIDAEVFGYYLEEDADVEETGLDLDEDEFERIVEDKIDLSSVLKAALIYDLPMVPLHDEDCLGLCPTCGCNLNEQECSCQDEPQEDFSKNPFAVLKDFDFSGSENSDNQ